MTFRSINDGVDKQGGELKLFSRQLSILKNHDQQTVRTKSASTQFLVVLLVRY